jgi:osmotically-inducible protein OsmY
MMLEGKEMTKMLKVSMNLMVVIMVSMAAMPLKASSGDTARVSASTVKALVERELDRRGLMKNQIAVAVDDYIVTLSGTVASLAEREKAGETARKVYAVSRVENKLAVGVKRSDEDIAAAVGKSIRNHPDYDAFDWVDGQVRGGIVTLTGSVREPWRKGEFEKRVMKIEGVAKIDNQIEALPLSTFDDEIRIQAVWAIYGSSTFNRYASRANLPIHIIVEKGRLVLKGVVANKLERQVAESLVRGSLLAFDIRNDLQVEVAN